MTTIYFSNVEDRPILNQLLNLVVDAYPVTTRLVVEVTTENALMVALLLDQMRDGDVFVTGAGAAAVPTGASVGQIVETPATEPTPKTCPACGKPIPGKKCRSCAQRGRAHSKKADGAPKRHVKGALDGAEPLKPEMQQRIDAIIERNQQHPDKAPVGAEVTSLRPPRGGSFKARKF